MRDILLRGNTSTAEVLDSAEEAQASDAERRVVNKSKPQGLDALRAEVQRKLAAQIDLGTPDPEPPRAEARPAAPKPERRRVENLRADIQKSIVTNPGKANGLSGLRRGRLSPSRIAMVFIALVAGGLAAFLAMENTSGSAVAQPVAEPQTKVIQEATTQVLVAKQEIGVGQRVTPAALEWVAWPERTLRPEFITIAGAPDAMTQVSGSVARVDVYAGEPIRKEKLAPAGGGYLSAILDKGKRAVSVSVGAESASGGFVLPNDHVDVVLTRQTDLGQESQTILSNVKVLAVNTRLGETGASGTPSESGDPKADVFTGQAIATLELDSMQAQVIINAGNVGRLALVLRPTADYADASSSTEGALNASIRMTSPFWTSATQGQALK